MIFTFHNTIELLGIIAFGLSGALSAMQKRLDVFGVLVITFVTAIGGGTLRDLLIGSLPVAWILDLRAIIILLGTYLVALVFSSYIRLYSRVLFWLDTAGLALFCVVAIDKGIAFQLHPMVCVALGTITGCFGGIIRDVILNEIPYVFRKDVYASACIAGGIVYFILLAYINDTNLVSILSGCVIAVIRIGAKYLGWQMPDVYSRKGL
ncbi:MAG: trimeric intracellular cation channel family protein [Bacteroidia bacterium]|jgi:uncharacterized membrane protein YeiH|nr:trimeric intracellular cation channel family protein [Bacteroidia bacterium]